MYDPNIHHRRSIRLKGYDYSKAGAYFITICCEKMACRFGYVKKDGMVLNEFGKIAYNEWVNLLDRFDCFELDVFQIMPNHMHAVLVLKDVCEDTVNVTVGATLAVGQADFDLDNQNQHLKNFEVFRAGASPAPTTTTTTTMQTNNKKKTTIADIIGAYKSLVSNACLEICKQQNTQMGKLWQRNYYEHIVRNDAAYQNISHYILNNPGKWYDDKFYKEK